ncbi:MAG: ABC transporter ATP-binding protein, partial [Thermomicrobiales bacterium]
MGFVMDGLDAEQYDRTYSDRELLRRITGYFKPAAAAMVLVAVMIIANSLAGLVTPLLGSWGIDKIVNDGAGSIIWVLFFGLLAGGVLAWIFNYIRQIVTAKVVGGVVLHLREDAFDAVLKRDLSVFDENPSATIVSRVTSDSDDFANVVTLTMNLLSQILLVLLITVILFTRNVQLAFVAVAITPVFVLIALGYRKIARETTPTAQRSTAQATSASQEAMSGIGIAKTCRQEATLHAE